ncbi:Creatinase/aminopeptidase [Nadsonia fulvescens var. elongata DSM 6958]|uniref:Creatinase/aminopeptidase n=1 Tax=Nadsonia fulvescens var. elongata DSM 6958 TaxID=857566 RepID=A0A1E3PKS8_9ASCO|nr:Creatinase/aminopeptidase [Nadsonia fulvescens var. elongata DSM 6958]
MTVSIFLSLLSRQFSFTPRRPASKYNLFSSATSSSHITLFSTNSMAAPTSSKLAHLRQSMAANNVGVYIVPSEDEHQSEYTSPADARRSYISNFTGSAGTAVITASKAALATDGRYFLQAADELDSNWELLKQGVKDVPTWQDWAISQAIEDKVNIGVDARLITADQAKIFKEKLAAKITSVNNISDAEKTSHDSVAIVQIDQNLVDIAWGADKPTRSKDIVTVLDPEFTGKSFKAKIADLRKTIKEKKSKGIVISSLDEIAWLFNLRGSDIPYNPVFFAYALITDNEVKLYLDHEKITDKLRSFLGASVLIKPYNEIFSDAAKVGEFVTKANLQGSDLKLLVPSATSWALVNALGEHIESVLSPVQVSKAIKNDTEIAGAKLAHIKDGVALVKYYAWLEDQLEQGAIIDEVDGATKSLEIRQEQENFVGLSFETISSSGANAAIIHYAPTKGKCAKINIDEIYLNDTGAQFLEGTTDTTRTFHFAKPNEEEKRSYTLVLKGHIALANAIFPEGTTGYMLDTFARQFLWADGKEYRHGTGHGIGSFLNVHEGPIGVGFRPAYLNIPFEPGHYCSNEPGYYVDGAYGIRIESNVVCVEKNTRSNFGEKKFYGFDTITRVPLCRNLMDLDLLTIAEKSWINNHHQAIFNDLNGLLAGDKLSLEWLKKETAPLE